LSVIELVEVLVAFAFAVAVAVAVAFAFAFAFAFASPPLFTAPELILFSYCC